MARENLKAARKEAGYSAREIADMVFISLRQYWKIEQGESLGSIPVWDSLEDILGVNQRVLREIRLDTADNL